MNDIARRLKEEMGLAKTANLRDYQGLVEDSCARELGDKEELTWAQAVPIPRRLRAKIEFADDDLFVEDEL